MFSVANAEIKTYDGVGVYIMKDETLIFAKNKAELDAQRNILEKICTYVKSESDMIGGELNSDEVITVSAGILHVIDTKFSMTSQENGILIKSFVTAEIDTDELEKLLEKAIKERVTTN